MADNSERPIIIKKIKKMAAGHHGGSWKVAYADFVTAMMAFFLLMWLLATASASTRAAIEYYFKNHSVFSAGSGVMNVTSAPRKTNADTESKDKSSPMGNKNKSDKGPEKSKSDANKEATQKEIRKMIDLKLSQYADQMQVDITPEGVRINIMDKDGQPMFLSGAAQFQGWSAQVLKVLAEEINRLPNPVVIEGHTDAVPFAGNGQLTNWELSTQRSMAARRALEFYGVDRARFSKIIGYADKQLLMPDKPTDPRNRRISVILQFEDAEQSNMKAIDLLSTDDSL
jgi:chemotaxis protein MotB